MPKTRGTTLPHMGVERKMKRYQAISGELADLGITYKPFVYSSLGAPDPGAIDMLTTAARKQSQAPRAGTPWGHPPAVESKNLRYHMEEGCPNGALLHGPPRRP